MSNYERYSRFIIRSVDHIFKNFLNDFSVQEVFEAQSDETDPKVCVELRGSINGEIIINLPVKTLNHITEKIMPNVSKRSLRRYHEDVAGEIANLITGTFANQLQFLNHTVRLSAPDFNEDQIVIKTFYENINLSFISALGGFDIDLYYREE